MIMGTLKKIYSTYTRKIVPLCPTSKIPSVTRISLNLELRRQFKRLKPGIVLDAGSRLSPYRKYIPHTRYIRLDNDEKTHPDICCDVHEIKWQSDFFDIVIATEILVLCYDPEKVIDEIYRVLKPKGICILSTRFMHKSNTDPKDYYRFTKDSLNYLFRKFSKVEIYHHGNKLQVIWDMINSGKTKSIFGIILNLFNPVFARIKVKNTAFPHGHVVYAEK